MFYRVYVNMGDDQWDDYPEVDEIDTLEEVVEWLELTEEQIKELEEEGFTCDEEVIYYKIHKLEEEERGKY